jgi:hypothetical protein
MLFDSGSWLACILYWLPVLVPTFILYIKGHPLDEPLMSDYGFLFFGNLFGLATSLFFLGPFQKKAQALTVRYEKNLRWIFPTIMLSLVGGMILRWPVAIKMLSLFIMSLLGIYMTFSVFILESSLGATGNIALGLLIGMASGSVGLNYFEKEGAMGEVEINGAAIFLLVRAILASGFGVHTQTGIVGAIAVIIGWEIGGIFVDNDFEEFFFPVALGTPFFLLLATPLALITIFSKSWIHNIPVFGVSIGLLILLKILRARISQERKFTSGRIGLPIIYIVSIGLLLISL